MNMRPLAPSLNLDSLPVGEHQRAHFIEDLLYKLDSHCYELEAAILLFEHAGELIAGGLDRSRSFLLGRWEFIAARDAVSTVYKASEDITALGENINRCPQLLTLLDAQQKRAATKAFKKHFPDFEGVRHGAHHSGKLYGTPERLAEHASGPIVMINNLFGSRLQTAFNGRQVSFDVSRASLEKLVEVRDLYWGAFARLDRRLSLRKSLADFATR